MPTPHSDRHARLTTEASDTTHRSNPAVQADGNESGVFLNIPKPSSGSLTHDTHTRSRSVDEMESTSTPFYFGQGKSSDFVTTGLNSHSRANPMTFPSISLIQAEDATTSSLRVTGEEKSHHNDVFCFGNNSGKDTAQPVFSFGFLHNYTPLPSPRASPAAQVTDASYRDPTSSQGSSPLATGSTAGIHLSPPRLSLNQSSSSSTPDITDRLSSLSLAATSTTSIALSTSSENPPDETANNHGHITGSESSPEPYDPREEPGPEHVSLEIELSFSLHRPHINSYYPNIALLWLFRCWGQLPNVWWNECCPAGSDRVRYVTPRVRHVRHEATLFGTDHYIPQHLMSLMRAQCSNWRLVSSPLQTRDRDRGFWCWSRGSRPPTPLHRNLDSGLASAPIRQPIKLSCMQLAGRLTSSAQK